MKLRAADLFCGAGGTSAGACATGEVKLVCAVNHWSRAIETHEANFPGVVHMHSSIDKVDPRDCEPMDLLFASPECTSFSKARGKRKRSRSSRCLAMHTIPWIEIHRPRFFVFENVEEFREWGPLDRNERPIESLMGGVFDAWLMLLQAYGYRVECRVLNAADYGAATSRERLFIIGRRGRRNPVWPNPSSQHKPFLSVLDNKLPLRHAVDRGKPLCPNTMSALHRGREALGESRWIHAYYGNSTCTSINRPLPTITTKDRFALVDVSSGDFALRMLSNGELAAAQGFHSDYQFCGNQKEVTVQIGNSVSPPVAQAITQAILSV